MSSSQAKTRVPGILYALMGLPGVVWLQYMPAAFIVPGDATATARRIAGAALTYRIGILCALISSVSFVLLALSLYGLFKDVDKKHARLLVALVLVSATIGIVNEVNHLAPLILLSGADFLSVFTKSQLDALAMGFLRLHGGGLALDSAFWGLWLFPFGVLVIKSGFFPKILGICLIVGGFAYLAESVTLIALPAYRQVVSQVVLPFYAIGEVPILLWLLIKGAPVPRSEARPAL
jgi:hypothetical protein